VPAGASEASAHSHWARNPSSSDVVGRQPSSRSIFDTSAFVRCTSPASAARRSIRSVLPEIRSSIAIASGIEASSPPPTLYSEPDGAPAAAIVAFTASPTYVKLRDCAPDP
jgi:hypothetical protein